MITGTENGFAWLLNRSWQAGVLVLCVLLLQALFRRRLTCRWRFALWWIVLARLVLPVGPESPLSLFNWFRPAAPAVVQLQPAPAPVAVPAGPESAEQRRVTDATPFTSAAAPDLVGTKALRPGVASPLPAAGEQASAQRARHFGAWMLPWLIGLWLLGVIGLAAGVFIQLFRFKRQLAQSANGSDPEAQSLLADCQRELGIRRRIELLSTAAVKSPALFGLIRLRLLLPRGLTVTFDAQELRYIFLHELAHVRRRDPWLNALVTTLQILHWFNPLLWFGFARLRADRELACDELALQKTGAAAAEGYGATIIKLLEGLNRPAAIPGLVGILEDKQQIRRRLVQIARFKQPSRWSALAGLLLVGLSVVGLTDASHPVAANAEASRSHSSAYPAWTPKLSPEGFKERLWGTVLYHGRPAPHARLRFMHRVEDDGRIQPLGDFHVADEKGRFLLWDETNAQRLVVRYQDARAEVDLRHFTKGSPIRLQGPGTIEGRLEFGGRPVTNQVLLLARVWDSGRDDFKYWARTDATGHFAFHHVPGVEWKLWRAFPCRTSWAKPPTAIATVPSTGYASVGPQLAQVTAREGQVVRLDLRFPPDYPMWRSLQALASAGLLFQTNSAAGTPATLPMAARVVFGRAVPAQSSRSVDWGLADVHLITQDRSHMRVVQGFIQADGAFRFPRVAPGKYDLWIAPQGWPAAGPSRYVETIGTSGPIPVSVPTNAASGNQPLDLGRVFIRLRRPLKIGEVAPPFSLKTVTGQTVRLADYVGRPVLLVFWWASPYSPDRKLLRAVEQLRRELGPHSRLAVIGLNFNKQAQTALASVRAAKLDWPQCQARGAVQFFRDHYEFYNNGDMLLLGPHDQVLARHWNVAGIRPAIEKALRSPDSR